MAEDRRRTYRRRGALAGLASAGGLLLGGCQSGGDAGGDTDGTTTARTDVPTTGLEPVRVETLDARGSSAGELVVPPTDTVTLVDVFASWCTACKLQFERLVPLYPQEDVRFVSVTSAAFTNELDREELADWWDENGGPWTVGYDHEEAVTGWFDSISLPQTVVTDAAGEVVWKHGGLAETETLREQLRRAHESDRTGSAGGEGD